MSNEHYIKMFKRKEWALRILYLIYTIIVIIWWYIVWVKQYIDFTKPLNQWFNAIDSILQIAALSISFRLLSTNMQKYQIIRWVKIKRNLWFFFIVSFINLMLNAIISLIIYYLG